MMWEPIRTALFVPGNRPDRVDKAVITKADAIIIDLEDAVPVAQKVKTRPKVREKILEHQNRKIIVRVNAINSDFFQGDIDEVVVKELRYIMFPKVETKGDLQEINKLLLELEKKKQMQPGTISVLALIESAKGVQNIDSILTQTIVPHRLVYVAFGAADYALDMGIELTRDGAELSYPRSRIAVACRAAGLPSPLDTPFLIDLKDVNALRVDAKRAKQLGFHGKLCIHPAQIEPCNKIFSPTKEEILYAQTVVKLFEEAEAKGLGAIQLDGKFIDYPVVDRSRHILKLASLIISK